MPKGLYTSGLSQPPVVVSMIAEAANLDPDRSRAEGFLREVYPKLKSLHEYLFEFRDPFRENLVYVVHPWESGLDNAPLWDEPLAAIERETAWSREMQRRYDELAENGDRPKRTYISKYSYLIENLFTQNYDWNRIAQNHPFQIQDVLFNVILCRAERDLGKIAEIIGAGSDAHFDRAEKIKDAVNSKLWDETQGLYYDYDLISGKMIRKDTIFSYMPLFAGIPNEQRGRKLLDNLRTHCFCVADGDCVAVPSYDMCQVDYQGEFYWRGPVWVNINWYLAQGVREFGEEELADWIERSLITLVDRHGFYEYFDPDTGKGLGASEFSWTAALIIDLIARRNGSAITNRP